MKPDLTDITLVIDRSGSMEEIRSDAAGGVNAFIRQQAQQPGETLLTLVQFDDEYEFVHRGVPIKEVPPYTLVPRSGTALLDAVGRAINETADRLAKMACACTLASSSISSSVTPSSTAATNSWRKSRGKPTAFACRSREIWIPLGVYFTHPLESGASNLQG